MVRKAFKLLALFPAEARCRFRQSWCDAALEKVQRRVFATALHLAWPEAVLYVSGTG
jgi:hypothetical protein